MSIKYSNEESELMKTIYRIKVEMEYKEEYISKREFEILCNLLRKLKEHNL